MNSEIYLDNSSTTKPCKSAVDGMLIALTEKWGNPSSLHRLGIESEEILNNAKKKAAELIGKEEREIFFTSGGTEANNLALLGAAEAMKRRGNRIITTSVEHPSVLEACDYLSHNGFETVKIKPESDGHIDPSKVISAVDDKTVLVSVMLVNNETGCIFPVKEIAAGVKEKNPAVLMHTDCVQAFGKLPVDAESLGVDLISASGHKIHGPKGIGFLYKSKTVFLRPIVFGGHQENNLRSGTEAVPAIAGFLGAMNELSVSESLKRISELNGYARSVFGHADGFVINSPTGNTLPYILNISVPGFRSETMLHFLEERNIFVSSGSACSKGKGSYVLHEMGLSSELIDSAIRISFSRFSTREDVDALFEALETAKKVLRRNKR